MELSRLTQTFSKNGFCPLFLPLIVIILSCRSFLDGARVQLEADRLGDLDDVLTDIDRGDDDLGSINERLEMGRRQLNIYVELCQQTSIGPAS